MQSKSYSIDKVRNIISQYECELVSETYKNFHQKINIKCICGEVFITTLGDFIKSKFHCCKKCVSKKKQYYNQLSYEELSKYIKEYGCELITEKSCYENVRTYIDIKCRCGNIYNLQAFAFRASKTKVCPQCSRINSDIKRKYSKEEIIELINISNERNNTSYVWIDKEYQNVDSELIFIDNEGYKYQTTPHNIIYRNTKLSKYHQSNPFTIENIKNWLKINAIGYELLSTEYISVCDKLLFKCPDGHEFEMWFSNMQSGQRCPICYSSNGEKHVRNSLLLNNLNFKSQYSFKDLYGKRKPLLFDFAVFKDSECTDLWFLIEYDGELHYEEARFLENSETKHKKLIQQQKYDALKDNYCKDNDILLLRIPYWEKKNINNIIESYINNVIK